MDMDLEEVPGKKELGVGVFRARRALQTIDSRGTVIATLHESRILNSTPGFQHLPLEHRHIILHGIGTDCPRNHRQLTMLGQANAGPVSLNLMGEGPGHFR